MCICVLGMSIVYMYMYVWYDVHVHVCMRVAHRVYMCTHVHVHDADTQHTCPCMCQHMRLLPNTHEYTMLLPKPHIHDPQYCSHRSECLVRVSAFFNVISYCMKPLVSECSECVL